MRKSKFIAFAALALVVTGCTSEDAVNDNPINNGQTPILLDSYIGGMSRATHVATDANKGHDFKKYGFTVYANVTEASTGASKQFMNNQKVVWNEASSKWTYAPIKYWPTEAGSTVDFYPRWMGVPGTMDEKNIEVITDWNNIPQVTFYVNDIVKDQTDYIWAEPKLNQKRTDYSVDTPVKFQFHHALSAFEFALKTIGIDESVTRVAVESVTLTGYFAPKATLNVKETNVSKIWNLQGDWEKRSYTISDPEEEMYLGMENDRYNNADYTDISRSGSNLKDPAQPELGYEKGTIMVLPFGDKYTVTLRYTVYTWPTPADKAANNFATASKETYTISRDVEGVNLKPGFLYKNLISLELLPVNFGAELVDWNIVTKEYSLLDNVAPISNPVSIGGTSYASMSAALAAVPTDGTPTTIKMTDDIVVPSERLIIPAGGKVTIDLNGFAINSTFNDNGGAIRVLDGAELVIDDTSAGKTGSLNAENNVVAIRPVSTAKVTINGGTFVGKEYAVSGNGNEAGSQIVINGGTFIANAGPAVYHPQNGTMIINGGTFKGSQSAVEIRAGHLQVNGGEFVSTASAFSCNPNGDGTTTTGAAIAIAQHTTKKDIAVEINGGSFKGIRALNESNPQNNDPAPQVTLSVANGNFTGAIQTVDVKNFISGGTFNVKPGDEYLSTGKTASYEGGAWIVK